MAFEELECVQIEFASADLLKRKECYLEAKGWRKMVATLDRQWRWTKDLSGKCYCCDREEALYLQGMADKQDYQRAHPAEFEDKMAR